MDYHEKTEATAYEDVVSLCMRMIEMDYIADIIRDISDLVKLPTVYDPETVTEGKPYGRAVALGYEWIRDKALSDGFEVMEYDGHALAIRIKETDNPHRIDVVSHVDVVAAGEGWEREPFCGSVAEDYIYGRGTVDMKGTLILTYYALKYIKENKLPCKRELRLVIGCDEERTMQDMRYYIRRAGVPDFAFTPDGKFPYSLGEKGALMWTLEGELPTCIEEFDGGVGCNVVSPIATAKLKGTSDAERYREEIRKNQYNAKVSCDKEYTRIILEGKAAHASVPEAGFNANVALLGLIASVSEDPLAELLYHCFRDYYGKGAGLEYDIAPMGKLTINLGVLKIFQGKLTAQVDCRYPKGVTSDLLTGKLKEALAPIRVVLNYDDEPTLADASSPYLKILLSVYREVSKDQEAQPFISGGVTYSKVIPNCVAFGPEREGEPPMAHQANERLELERIPELFEIYKEAMIRLADMEEFDHQK